MTLYTIHLILYLILWIGYYSLDTILYIQYRLLFKIIYISFELFVKQKIANRNFLFAKRNRKQINLGNSSGYFSRFWSALLNVNEVKIAIRHVLKTFHQFRIFIFDPMPKNENTESAESLTILSLLFKWYLLTKYWCLNTYKQCYHTVETPFTFF